MKRWTNIYKTFTCFVASTQSLFGRVKLFTIFEAHVLPARDTWQICSDFGPSENWTLTRKSEAVRRQQPHSPLKKTRRPTDLHRGLWAPRPIDLVEGQDLHLRLGSRGLCPLEVIGADQNKRSA